MREDYKNKLDKIFKVVKERTGINPVQKSRQREIIDTKKMFTLLSFRATTCKEPTIAEYLELKRANIYNLKYGALALFDTDKQWREDYLYCLTQLNDMLDSDLIFFLIDYHKKSIKKLESSIKI